MNQPRVVALGFDSADPDLLFDWARQGRLPNFQRLRESGTLCRLNNRAHYAGGDAPYASTEGAWVEFQTCVRPNRSGYWEVVHYDPRTYDAGSDPVHGGYDYREFPPFYALGDAFRVAALDVPVSAVCPHVNGLQVVGYGGHYPFVERGSQPESLLAEITEKYGRNEILYNDSGVFWNRRYLEWLERASIQSIRQRTRLTRELLEREPWDLFLSVFGESHGASHDLWFTAHHDHPVHGTWTSGQQPLENVFRELDDALGQLRAMLAPETRLVCFSLHGMQSNCTDVSTFFALAELLYRRSFPGRVGFAAGDIDQPPPAAVTQGRHGYWFGELWRRKHTSNPLARWWRPWLPAWLIPGGGDLRYPFWMDMRGREAGWLPSVWYRPAWPRMKAFSLPAFADGHVRINLAGRESSGVVPRHQYEAECEQIREFLLRVKHGRTGAPVVRDVIRTRRSPEEDDPRLPHADLIVVWADAPCDVFDSPDVGRIGPVPFYRSGGHRHTGFLLASGPGIEPHGTLPEAEAIDIGPTLLQLLGAPVPPHFDGRSILELPVRQRPPI